MLAKQCAEIALFCQKLGTLGTPVGGMCTCALTDCFLCPFVYWDPAGNPGLSLEEVSLWGMLTERKAFV